MKVQRGADLRLRSSTGPTRTQVWWPVLPEPGEADGLLLFLVDSRRGEDSVGWLRELASRARIVIVAAPCATDRDGVVCWSVPDATTALEWAADNARQLEADPAQLLIGGNGLGADLATAAAAHAAAAGWPLLERRILLPTEPPDGASPPGIAPATVVTFGDASWPVSDDVERLHYADASDPSLVLDVARSLVVTLVSACVTY